MLLNKDYMQVMRLGTAQDKFYQKVSEKSVLTYIELCIPHKEEENETCLTWNLEHDWKV